MKQKLWRSVLAVVLVLSMVLPMCTPVTGLATAVSATETTVENFDALTIQEILALDESLTWVFAGDSITHNASFTNGMNSYPEWFEQYLYTLGRQDAVINTAWGGAVVEDFLYYEDTPDKYGLKDNDGETGKGIENMITNYNPDVVFIKLGMNNRGTATDTFTAYYKKMLDAIYAEGEKNGKIPKIIVITPTPLGGDSLQGKEYFADKINQATADNVWRFQMILEDLVPEYNTANGRNMEFVDFMTGFTSEALVVGDAYAGTFFIDGSDGGLHPNQAAQYLMFNILCKSLGLYDETNPVFGFTYDDINNRAHYTDDTYISDYTGQYHSELNLAAKIGDTEYATFTEAFNAAVAAGEGTITLCADVTVDSTFTVPAGVSVTVTDDGNAYSITRGDSLTATMFDVSGSLTLSATSANRLSVDGNSVSAAKPAVMVNGGATVTVTNVEFTDLVSTGSAGAFNVAGASGNVATLNVTGATFSGNTGTTGGVIYFGNYAVGTIENSVFVSNQATSYGGVFYCENYSSVNAVDSLFLGNSGTSNGGAFMLACDGNNGYGLTLTGCTVAGNTAPYGGGLYAWKESGLTLDGTTFCGNTATTTAAGNDIHFRMNGTDAKEQLTVKTSGTDPVRADIYFQSGCKGKVYVVGTLTEGSDVSYNWDSAAGFNLTFDSAETAAANKAYVSLADSLAASYELVYSDNVATVTAYTAAEVTNVAKVGNIEYATLAEAISAAGTEGTVTLIADATVDATIAIPTGTKITITDDGNTRKIIHGASLTGSMFTVTGTQLDTASLHDADAYLTLKGKLIVDGANVSATAPAFNIGTNAAVVMEDVTVRNIDSTVNGSVFVVAGKWMNRARLSLDNVTVENNSTTQYGIIWANHAFVDCNDSLFEKNSAGNGGVMYCENFSTNTINSTVFAGNSTSGSGGVFLLACDKDSQGYGLYLTDCILSGNSAANGGAIYAWKETNLSLDGCTILGNSVTGTAAGKEIYFRMNGSDSKEALILKATNHPLRTSIYTHTGMVGGLFVQGTLAAGSDIVLNWDNATNMNVTYDSAELAQANKPYVHLAEALAATSYLAYSENIAAVTSGSDKTAAVSVQWTTLVAENNTWVIAGTQQVFGFQSLNAHRSIFRLMDGSVRCWWPYKDNRFVQVQGTDVEALLASFEADTGMMADGQSIDVYVLIPQVNAVYEAGYTHSDELVAAYKTAVQAIADKAKAAGMTLVLWTPLANADDTVNGYITDYANAVREIGQADAANILTFDANLFMNEQMSANAALKNNWFAEGASISPLLANDIVRAFWSKSEMCDDALLNQVRDHNLRIGTDKQIHKGNYIADGIAYGVSVSGEQVTVDASAILAAYPEITNLRVAVLPAAGCGNYNEGIWNDYAVIENGTATFNAPWDNAAITVYGQVGEYTYRFKDVTLSVSVANDLSLPVYTTDSLTDLRVVGAPAFGFDAATTTYTVNLYQYQKNVQLLAQGGENLTVTVNGETVKVGQLSQQIAVSGKTATVTVTVTGGASNATYTLNLVKPDYPDIIITEVMEDPNYTSGLYELVELYNASGKDLNIKDYALGYKIENAYALIADDGSGNSVDGGLTPDQFTGDSHIFHAVSGTGSTYTSINEITKNSVNWTDAVEPETIAFPADSTMVVWIKQNWQDTKDTESYEDLVNAVKAAAGDTTLVVAIDGVETPVAPTADQIVMAEDPDGNDGGQDVFSNKTSEAASENFYLENSGVGKRFWLFVTEAGAVRDDNGSITEAGDDIISAARWNRATAVAGLSTALIYNTDRGFALPYGEGTTAAADTKTTFGAIEYWQKPYDLEDVTVPGAVVTENETGITVTLTDDTDVRYLYLQIDADGDGTFETEIVKDLVLEAGVKNAGVSADQTSYTYTYADACVNYKGYVLDGNNNKTEFATPVTVAKIGDVNYGTLAEAIEAANAMESATIVLLMDVTADETCIISGNVTITDNGSVRTIYRGRELTGKLFDVTGTLNLIGTAADLLKIDGNGVEATGQVISVGAAATLNVENTVLNGLHSGTYNNAALYFNTGSSVSVKNSVITGTVGASVYAQGAPAADTAYSFEGVTFSGNSADAAGAVFNSAKNAVFTITGCTFENNAATGHGGVIYADQSTYTITDSTFTGNKTTGGHGGAITVSANANSKVYITDSAFDGNSAAGHGGTIYARNGACTVEITGGSIKNSTAGRYGGAIMGEANSIITVKNVAFSGNSATDPGEDIAVAAAGVLTVDGCTMSSEETNVYVADGSVAPTVKATEKPVVMTMQLVKGSVNVAGTLAEGSAVVLDVPANTTVKFDSAEAAEANISCLRLTGALVEAGYKLRVSGDTATVLIPAIVAQVGDTQYETLVEAIEAANAVEGGATVTLLADCTVTETITVSGNVTLVDNGNAVTITRAVADKIFEVTGTLTVTGSAASAITIDGADLASTTVCFNVTGSVHFKNVDIKNFHSGAWGSNMFYLNKGPASSFENVNFYGGSGQMFYIQGAASDSNAQTFTDCTFKDYAGTANGSVFNGAAYANMTITGCTFENIANGAHGGVIYIDRSTYNISDSVFKNNACGSAGGGAIAVSNQSGAWNTLNLTNCQFIGNSAGKGGAIWLRSSTKSQSTIVGCTFTGNNAGSTGGAILADANANITVDGCSFSENAAANGQGNDIYIYTATVAKHIFKTTQQAMTADIYIYSGAIKVAGDLMEGSSLNLTWNTVPGAEAVLFDSYPAATSNVSKISTTNSAYTLTTADDSPAVTLYNEAESLADVYVASTGADTNAGTEDAPVATLNKALELVKNGGTVHIVDSYTADQSFVWASHNKDVTITGGTLDFSAMGNGIDFYQGDAVTFDNLTLTLGGWNMYFANGHRLQINENVTVTKTDTCLFGGGGWCYGTEANGHTVYGTDVTVMSGTWFKLYGGGRVGDVEGDSKLYVGGNVNAGHTVSDEGSTQLAYGGGYKCNISGDIYLTIADNVKMNFIYGGLELGGDTNYTVGGDIHVLMSGGETYSIYGGHKIVLDDGVDGTQTGNIDLTITGGTIAQVFGATRGADQIGNVTVHVKGGTVTRRLFGGCYNEYAVLSGFSSDYHVVGNVEVYIYEGVNFAWNSSESDLGLYAHSRYDLLDDEVTSIYFMGEAAQTKHEGDLAAHNSGMSMVMGSSTKAADNISCISLAANATMWNLTLADDIGVNFHVAVDDKIADTAVMSITVAGNTTDHKLSNMEKVDGLYVFRVNVAAAQMTDAITLQLTVDGAEGEPVSYTVAEYGKTILSGDYTEEVKALVENMLNYGGKAQTYFGYNTDNMADSGITVTEAEVPTEAETAMAVEGEIEGIKYYGASLLFRSKTAVRIYFQGDVSGCSFTANGKTYEPVAKDGMYYVEIAEIAPQDLDDAITVVVKKGDSTLSVTYGPMNYIVRMYASTGKASLKALLEAMYSYHLAAESYVDSIA